MPEQVLLRFYLTNFVQWHHQPLYEALAENARHRGLSGATVLKGIMGFSMRGGKLLRERALAFANQLPVIVEIIDRGEAIADFVREIEPMLEGAMLTFEGARVLARRARTDEPGAAPLVPLESRPQTEAPWMELGEKGMLLRLFFGDEDHDSETGKPLYEALVLRAREAGLAGATVLRGQMGFGKHSRLHTAHVLALSQDLPIVIEIVDSEDKINAFLPVVDELVREGLVTIEEVRVVKYSG